jgi:hypothetical protein
MMGIKTRTFASLPDLSLEELVPQDNFYRRLQERIDLSFVRELVRDCYALALPPFLIHPSAWNRNSRKFAYSVQEVLKKVKKGVRPLKIHREFIGC